MTEWAFRYWTYFTFLLHRIWHIECTDCFRFGCVSCVFEREREREVVRNYAKMLYVHSINNRGQSHIMSIIDLCIMICTLSKDLGFFILCICKTVKDCQWNGNTQMWHLHYKLCCLKLLFTLLQCIYFCNSLM